MSDPSRLIRLIKLYIGEFSAGDRGVFVVIDTIIPRAPWSEFLVDIIGPTSKKQASTHPAAIDGGRE